MSRDWLSAYGATMAHTQEAVRVILSLPEHVADELTAWSASELFTTAEDVLETLADELTRNRELRAFVAGLVED